MVRYTQEDFDESQVKLDDYGNLKKRIIIAPRRTEGSIEAGVVKGIPLEKYFTSLTIGVFPPRPSMDMKAFLAIKMIPKVTNNPLEIDDGKWTQMIKFYPEGLLGIISYAISTYIAMRTLQGFSGEKMTDELATAVESGKMDAEALMIDYKRLVRNK